MHTLPAATINLIGKNVQLFYFPCQGAGIELCPAAVQMGAVNEITGIGRTVPQIAE
jgi:hypothetical protein